MQANQLSLKIICSGQSKVFRFGTGTTILEACQEIKERLGTGDDTFGLFQAKTKAATKQHARSRWLVPLDKPLANFALENGDEIEFKSTNRPVKVAMPDGSYKTVQIDDSSIVEKIIDQMGSRLGLANAEEYGISVVINGKDTWLQPRFTLQEQPLPVGADAALNFRKRFFVDDANVDKSDPTQLNFIYTQSVGRVLDGTYPCKADEAALFAAIQLQVQTGNFQPANHNVAYIKKQNILPKQFQNKDLEAAVLKEWGKLVNTNEINAKFKYVSTVRSLPTFGITLWTVREQVPKKRKLQEVLLGLTRDAVVRLDPDTRAVLSTFPLKHVRRWAAGTNSFTLDYGQYKNEYYTVQVGGPEAEDISNTLAGYIDILLKRQRDGRLQAEVDEGELALVEELGPVCAVPNMSNIVMQGVGKYSPDDFRSLDLMPGLNMLSKGKAQVLPGQLVISDWGDAARRINQLTNDTPQEMEESDNDPSPVELKWNLLGQCANVGGSISDVLHHNPTTSAQKITDQLAELLKAAHKAANATSDISLLEAAKKVSTAVADVLRTAHDLDNDPESVPLKHRLAKAAEALKGTSALMARAVQAELVDQPSSQLILEAAEQTAQALKSFGTAAGETSQLRIAMPDLEALLASSRAFAVTGEDADNINLLMAARIVAGEVEKILSTSRKNEHETPVTQVAPDLEALLKAAKAFANAPNKNENINLLEAVDHVSKQVKSLLATSRKIDEVVALADALVERARNLAPLLMDPSTLDQFRLEADGIKRAAQAAFIDAKKMITDPVELQLLMETAKATNSAIVQMLNAAEIAVARGARDQEEVQAAASRVIAPLETIKYSGGDSKKVSAAAEETKKSVPSLLLAVKHQALAEPQRAEELLQAATVVTQAVSELGQRVRAMQTAEEEAHRLDEPKVVPDQARALLPDLESLLAQAKSRARLAGGDDNISLLEAVNAVSGRVKQLLSTSHESRDDLAAPLQILDQELANVAEADDVSTYLPKLLSASLAVCHAIEDPWQSVMRAAKAVADATKSLLTEQGEKFALFNVVRAKSKQAIASVLALANVASSSEQEVTSAEAKKELHAQTKAVQDVARRLVKELANASQNPDNWEAQATLVSTARELAKPFANMVNSARECIPAVESVATKQTLRFATQEAGHAIVEMVNACRAAGMVTGAQDVDEANQALSAAQAELDNAMSGQVSKTLSAEEAQAAVERELQHVMSAAGSLANASNSKDVGPAARDATTAVAGLVDACKALSAAQGKTDAMEGARELLPDVSALIAAAKANASAPSKDVELSLIEAVQRVNANVKSVLATTAGTDDTTQETRVQVKDAAVQTVQDALKELKPSRAAVGEPGDLVSLSADLEKRTGALAMATNRVCQLASEPKTRPEELDAAVSNAAAAFPALVTAVNKIASSAKSADARQAMVQSTQLLGGQLGKVLANAAAARVDPQAREALEEGYRGGMGAGRDLLVATRSAMPGLQDLEKALHLLERCLSEDVTASVSAGDESAVRGLPALTDRLGDAAVGIIRAARVEPDELGAQCVALARCLSDILDVTRSFCPAARSLASALPIKQLLASLVFAKGAKAIEVVTKKIMAAVPALMEAAKVACEDHPDSSSSIKNAAKAVKPSLTSLVAAAKGAKNAAGQEALKDSCAEFADVISTLMTAFPEGGAQVSRLMTGAAGLVDPVQGMILVARSLADASGDAGLVNDLTVHGKALGAAVRVFRQVTKSMSPGTVECELALKEITCSVDLLDEAAMDAAVGILQMVAQQSNQVAQENMVNVAKLLATRIQAVVEAIKASDFDLVARSVGDVAKSVEQIKNAALQLASTSSNQDIQSANLNMAKNVADSTRLFTIALSELTVDRSSTQLKRDLASSATAIRDSIQTLMKTLRDGVVGLRACDEALAEIAKCRATLDGKPTRTKGANYGECQSLLIEQARTLVQGGTSLFHVAKTEPQAVGDPSKSVAEAVHQVTESAMRAAGAADDKQVQKMLLLSMQTVCNAVENLVASSKRLATDQNDVNMQSLSAAFEDLSDRVANLIRSLKEGATGERDCKEAAGQMRKVVLDLDNCAVSAATGSFKLDSKQPLSVWHAQTLQSVKLVKDQAAAVIASISEGQSALGLAASALAQSFASFANNAKFVSGVLADITVQSDLLVCSKSIGATASGLVMAAAGKEKKAVEDRLIAVKNNVTELERLLKEHVSGPSAGVSAVIKAQASLEKMPVERNRASGENVAAMLPALRRIAANEFFLSCRSTSGSEFSEHVAFLVQDLEQAMDALGAADIKDSAVRKDVSSAAQALVNDLSSLLELLIVQRKDSDKYQDSLVSLNEAIGKKVERLVVVSRKIPGAGELELVESSLENLASQEMLNAAAQIQAAADMLNSMQVGGDVELDESDLAGSVLVRARSITAATIELVRAAMAAQTEINKKAGGAKDGDWAQGLMSSAKLVALSTQDLVAASNLVAKGELSEDAIIAIARTVGGATARLQAAAKARLDGGSPVQKQLNDAANRINAETKELMKEAAVAMEQSLVQEEQAKASMSGKSAFAARLEQQEKVNALSRQLENAYRALKIARQKEYDEANRRVAVAKQQKDNDGLTRASLTVAAASSKNKRSSVRALSRK